MIFGISHAIIGGRSRMYDRFIDLAAKHGDDQSYAVELLRLLPQNIKEAPVWFDELTRLWRYEYGVPFDRLPEGTIISGTNVNRPVQDLYAAIKLADKFLTRAQLLHFRERLSNREKHGEVLFEMRPVRDVEDGLQITYEVAGLGVGNKRCDWHLRGKSANVLLEVKCRNKSLIEHLKQITPDLNRNVNQIVPTAPNPEDLFKSVEDKFQERDPSVQLQGVWIHAQIKEDEESLTSHFNNILNKNKVHFSILSDWQDDGFILARNKTIRDLLKMMFHLSDSYRFTSGAYARTNLSEEAYRS